MYEKVRELYLTRGFGGRVGFGTTPAIAVIDMARSWLDETAPIGAQNVGGVITNIVKILEVGRQHQVPIFFTTMAFDPAGVEAQGPIGQKLPHLAQHLVNRCHRKHKIVFRWNDLQL